MCLMVFPGIRFSPSIRCWLLFFWSTFYLYFTKNLLQQMIQKKGKLTQSHQLMTVFYKQLCSLSMRSWGMVLHLMTDCWCWLMVDNWIPFICWSHVLENIKTSQRWWEGRETSSWAKLPFCPFCTYTEAGRSSRSCWIRPQWASTVKIRLTFWNLNFIYEGYCEMITRKLLRHVLQIIVNCIPVILWLCWRCRDGKGAFLNGYCLSTV